MRRGHSRGEFVTEDNAIEGTNGSRNTRSRGSSDVLELKLPLKPEYLPVIRATAGVIAGGMSFNYDEIVQVRVAVSEAFDLTMLRNNLRKDHSGGTELVVRFTVSLDRLEILIPTLTGAGEAVASQEETESVAVLSSLMDEVEFTGEDQEIPSIRLIKYRATIS